jgi:hypothetical protein
LRSLSEFCILGVQSRHLLAFGREFGKSTGWPWSCRKGKTGNSRLGCCHLTRFSLGRSRQLDMPWEEFLAQCQWRRFWMSSVCSLSIGNPAPGLWACSRRRTECGAVECASCPTCRLWAGIYLWT